MFLANLGKICFSKLSPILFYSLLLLPLICSTGYCLIQMTHFLQLEEQFYRTCKKASVALQKKRAKDQFTSHYSNASPYFLDEHVESLQFLEKEQNQLQALIAHPAVSDPQVLEERLRFLTTSNRFAFAEGGIVSSDSVKETEEKQKYPVEMSEEDLKRTLSLIEDISIESYPIMEHRPQLIITQFHVQKKQTPVKTEVFEVDMSFTKREFLQ
jgi:hypothetical protein